MPLPPRRTLATAALALGLLAGGGRATADSSDALTFAPILPPAGRGAMSPRWTAIHQGRRGVLFTWLEPYTLPKGRGKGHRLRAAAWRNGRWSKATTIARGASFFANWADTPGAIEGGDGTLYAHWLEKNGPEGEAYAVRLARSRDGGATWRALPSFLHGDRSPAEHGFVSWVPEGAGARAFWLDGRDLGSAGMGKGSMALRTATVGDETSAEERLDARVCDCCQTGAALAADGPVVAYRDRTDKEEVRDVYLLRRGTAGWGDPVRVGADGWEIEGCPVNGPAVAAQGRRVAVAWFTGAAPAVRVQIAFSEDGGQSFGAPRVVDDGTPIGRVDLAFDADGSAVVSWLAFADDGASLRLRRVRAEGPLGPALTLKTRDPLRPSSLPRILRQGDRLLLAWMEAGEPARLRAGWLPIADVR